MKLLLCLACNDIFNLSTEEVKYCSCGHTAGTYINNIEAVYHGERAFPIGFANETLVDALKAESSDHLSETKKDFGHTFNAFVIPWNSGSIQHVGNIHDYRKN